jgi:hypothetical protein
MTVQTVLALILLVLALVGVILRARAFVRNASQGKGCGNSCGCGKGGNFREGPHKTD